MRLDERSKRMGSPVYGTWIRPKKLVAFWILTLCLGSLSLLGLAWHPLFLTGLLALPFAYTAIVISMTALAFSEKGGDFQNKIHSLVIRSCALDTEVLDIGCGNGNMLINYAKTYPHGRYLGIDCWGDEWQYSKERCERNAKLEGIENIGFVQGSASSLPFPDASFSNVISCLTFHEVKDASDKLVS
ncbi:MAG TPA: class I SAM-dependent methyltransferase, partial [Rectinemataceae bacterium]|nr:class I SAM-dependent methyltransferase [Rectinemataceae bacterium]